MSQDHAYFLVLKGQVWLRHGVACLCLTVSIGILFLHYIDDLPTLKRLINTLPLDWLNVNDID